MRIYFLIVFLLVSVAGSGQKSFVSVSPYPVNVYQPDGSKLTIYGVGDEFNHFSVTEDGFTVLRNKNGFYEFAWLNKIGKLDFSGFRARNISERNDSERQFLRTIPKYLLKENISIFPKYNVAEDALQKVFPNTGNRKVLLLLIKYPDLDNNYPLSEFNDLMNENNYNGTGSFKDYYLQASDGNLSLSVDVFGWYVSKEDYLYYGEDSGDDRARELVAEAIDSAEVAGVDFSIYDNDGDGEVDNLMVVHSGPGAEEGSQTEYIWSHSWSLFTFAREYDEVVIDSYVIQPETRDYGIVGIGIFCHEFGHALGLPDLYDTDSENGDSEGLGNWCFMAGGSWLNYERTPAMPSAWVREELGWINPTVISTEGNYSLSPTGSSTDCFKMLTPNSNEYFLLENRYKTGFDSALPGSGLAIFHINSDKMNNDDENNKLSDLEEADGLNDLDREVNRGDAGDVFPGSSNNISFNDITDPNAQTYDSKLTGIGIQNIILDGSVLRFTLGAGVEIGKDLTYNAASNLLNIFNSTVDVDMQVKNEGTEIAGTFNVAFYLSTDQKITTSDYLVGSKTILSLAAGTSTNLNLLQNVSEIEPTIPSGNYYVGYIIDFEDDVEELDEENNNCIFTTEQVEIINRPNLTFNLAQNIFEIDGFDVSVELQVENQGSLVSDSCKIGFFISTNSPVESGDFFIGETALESLAPDSTADKFFSVNVLAEIPDLPSGEYYVGYIIDYENDVTEETESDNSFTFTPNRIDNILTPNLTFNPNENNLVITNTKINIELRVISNGETVSGGSRVGYYLSDDENITTSDFKMDDDHVSSLNVGESSNESVSIDITSLEGKVGKGDYFLGYIIDFMEEVEELDEQDNDFVFSGMGFKYCPPNVTVFVETICEGESVTFRDLEYNTSGVYEFVFVGESGCDSVIVLDLTVNPVNNTVLDETICLGDSVMVGETAYKNTGVYTEVFTNQFGCDSTVTLNLDVIDPIENILDVSICYGDSIEVAETFYSEPGTFIHELSNQFGCDSTVILNLTVNPFSDTLLVKTICQGDSILVGNSVLKESGIFTEMLINRFGCDSLITVDITVNPVNETIINEIICEGDSVQIGQFVYFESGTFVQTSPNVFGCDSTVILDLTVNPVNDTLLEVILCQGESIQVGNPVYTETGVFVENLTNRFGCDSIVTLILTVNPVHETLVEEIICDGDSVVIGSFVYKISGNYTDVLFNQLGCDSTVYLNLTVNPVHEVDIHENICEGTSYSFAGTHFSASGIYEHTFANQFGCDSLVILYLNVVTLPVVDLGDDFVMFSSESKTLDAGVFANYLWSTGDNTQTITINSSKGLGTKSYSVTATDEYSCSGSDEIEITIYNDYDPIQDNEPFLMVFPNPTLGNVNLLIEQVSGKYDILVFSENGGLVYQNEFVSPGNKFVKSINLSFLQAGVYTVQVSSTNQNMFERIIISGY